MVMTEIRTGPAATEAPRLRSGETFSRRLFPAASPLSLALPRTVIGEEGAEL
jgi:hypothetical protein